MATDGYIQLKEYGQPGKRQDHSVTGSGDTAIYRMRVESHQPTAGMDLSGRTRISELRTLFDGKALNVDDTFKWHNVGTGTLNFTANRPVMSVTAGQYLVRQSRHWNPYFSGKPQLIETTTFDFHNEAGVVKRTGYFSSNATAPYASSYDGIWLEADGTTHRLITSRAGTETHNIPLDEWDNGDLLVDYDWSKFSVAEMDFLWLGGAGARLFMVVNGVFTLIHTIDDHAGVADGLIMQSPQQPMRHEIRSTTGSGSFIPQCSQVATEGAIEEQGEDLSIYSAAIACNSIGTIYALCGIRKVAGYRDTHVEIDKISASIVSATTDSGVLMLFRNPTLSADLTWGANSRIEVGTAAAGQTITAGTGRLMLAEPINTSFAVNVSPKAALRAMTIDTDNVAYPYVVGYMPTSANQNVVASMTVTKF